jgi:hypothetical protein
VTAARLGHYYKVFGVLVGTVSCPKLQTRSYELP